MFPIGEIDDAEKYYGVTLGSDKDGAIWLEGFTRWKGYADAERLIEIRALAVVNAAPMARLWKQLAEPFMVANNDPQFGRWFFGGGHGLIEQKLLEARMPWAVEPDPCVHEPGRGFTSTADLPPTAFKRAPTPKVRMAVIKRDRYRCVLCGRSPSDYTDVELHVHHIRPFGQRGLTLERNLITLCHTCHKGLEPHYEWNLHGRLQSGTSGQSADEIRRHQYLQSVERYRNAIAADLKIVAT